DDGWLALDVPRDRAGTFEPRLMGKHERRFSGFDDKAIALCARGLSGRAGRACPSEPRLIAKHERRVTAFDDKVIALYARGLTVREIQAFLGEMYGVEVSPDLVRTVHGGGVGVL